MLRDFLIRRAVVPRTRGLSRRKLDNHDALRRVTLEDLLRSVCSQNLHGMTFEGLPHLALVDVELVLSLRAFPREDNISRHGYAPERGIEADTMMPWNCGGARGAAGL